MIPDYKRIIGIIMRLYLGAQICVPYLQQTALKDINLFDNLLETKLKHSKILALYQIRF